MKKNLLSKLLLSLFLFFSTMVVFATEPGDILITEYMADPVEVIDNMGEYIELYNNTAEPIDINGWTLKDDGTDVHVISSANGTTIIPAYGFLVLGLGDGSYNNRDYQYSDSDFRLSNTADQIILRDELQQICRTEYVSGFILAGIAMELNSVANHSFGTTIMSNQVLASFSLGSDYGSPGFAGDTDILPAGLWNLTEGETNVAIDFSFEITFNEGILKTPASEITDENVDGLIIFKKTDENGDIVEFDATINVNKKVVSISANDNLLYSQLYFLVIGSVEDAEGNTTDGDTLTFTTIAPPSDDATLSDLKVDGTTVTDFASSTFDYEVELEAGTTETPTVTATPNFEYAEAVVDPAADVTSDDEADRTTTITVTAEDGATEEEYTILFSVATSTGIIKITDRIKIYPNPNNGLFTLELNNRTNDEYTVEVYDVIGKIVYKSNITENVSSIDLTHMNAGLYYVSVNNGDEKNITKIIIQ